MLINVRLAQLEEPLVGPLPAWSVWGPWEAAVGLLGVRLLFQMPTFPPPAPALLRVWVCVCVHVTAACELSGVRVPR